MTITRRDMIQLLGTGAAALSTGAGLPVALAQPGGKLTILIGYPAGGAPDTVARSMTPALSSAGYMPIVDNRTGAGGRIATDALLKSPADGDTVMLAPGGSLTIYPHIYNKLHYDSLQDFAFIATACEFEFALAVGPQVPVETLAGFIAWAKANPAKSQFGTPGKGTGMHFLGVMLAREAKFEFQHIPYRGGAPALVDVMGGSVSSIFTTLPNVVQPHKAGKVRILAQSGAKRSPEMPDVPTFKESGFPNLTMSEMFVFVARAQTPPAQQQALTGTLNAAIATPDVQAALKNAEYSPLTLTPEQIEQRIKSEYARWGDVVKQTGYLAED